MEIKERQHTPVADWCSNMAHLLTVKSALLICAYYMCYIAVKNGALMVNAQVPSDLFRERGEMSEHPEKLWPEYQMDT